ncbi:alpha/beta hydrolase [Pseudomonas sp. GD04087]|uniref:alpha/beta hydrolase n=1 Tax=unclassified Pseudomonas TaxID=196821 RepID=UPI00244BB1C2|nr:MULTISPECIES: alpha/beta family hydrolase [unclassified Pseudomonas]MDH0288124.1 alpha/beta hydrolase [Pseudomonas sp. GD04087]MDH1052101.1 alpha/beta hydrolase [Pseudomonas sp. GD03903]MDH2002092.1 alpha/beta hydrolase [Pseudomonas sp. GD03691]
MSEEERRTQLIDGPVGKLQLLIDRPGVPPQGVALISHPQPLLGGSPRHRVPLTLSRKLCAAGWLTVRPSFRGVDGSEGEYAEGIGEAQDMLAVIEHLRSEYPGLPLALVGFSFGAYVFARVASELSPAAQALVLMGLPVGTVPGGRDYEAQAVPAGCLLLHGEADEMAPLANLLDWARPQQREVLLYTGADHFFKGCLEQAVERVIQHLQGALS